MFKPTYKIKEKCCYNYYIVGILSELVIKTKLEIIDETRKSIVLKLKE